MLKATLQFISLISSAMVLSLLVVVSTQAQTQYRVNIPFDFTIDQKSYIAGDYVIDALRTDSVYKPIAFRDAEGRSSRIILEGPGEDYSKVEVATLVFDQNETQYSLAVIRTPTFIVRLPRPKAQETLALKHNAQQRMILLARKN